MDVSPARVLPLLDATRWAYPYSSGGWRPVRVPYTWDCLPVEFGPGARRKITQSDGKEIAK